MHTRLTELPELPGPLRVLALLVVVVWAGVPLLGAQRSGETVYRVPVTGVIEMGIAPFIERSISEAEQAGAAAVILDVDTPGGRVDAAQRITNAIADAEVPVYAYVNRRAISAGAMISLATDQVYMVPRSVMGASTPVTGEGERASEKIVSVMRSEFRTIAEARGLDPRIAEAMVDEQIEIEGVVAEGELLTLTTAGAVEVGFAEEVAGLEALLEAIGAPGAQVVEMRANWAERTVRFLTNPLVAPFLLSIGFLGLLFEVKTPGVGIPGAAGVMALSLFFGSHLIIGLAGLEVFILLGVGVVLLLVELLVLPGFGIAGGLGGLAILAAMFMSMIGRFPTTRDILISLNVVAAALVLAAITAWQIFRKLPKDRRARSIFFEDTMAGEDYRSAMVRGELAGQVGTAVTDLRPAGTGRFGDEHIDVVSEGPWIAAGERIRVLRSEGYRHVVRAVEAAEAIEAASEPEDSAGQRASAE